MTRMPVPAGSGGVQDRKAAAHEQSTREARVDSAAPHQKVIAKGLFSTQNSGINTCLLSTLSIEPVFSLTCTNCQATPHTQEQRGLMSQPEVG